MPMVPTVLSASMRVKILAADCGAIDGDNLTHLCDAISAAVIEHITTAGVVLPTALVAPRAGGPVTGTGKIK